MRAILLSFIVFSTLSSAFAQSTAHITRGPRLEHGSALRAPEGVSPDASRAVLEERLGCHDPQPNPACYAIRDRWEARLGYAASGDFRHDADHGVEAGVRVIFDAGNIGLHLRWMFSFGEQGLNYMYLNSRLLRLRMSLDERQMFWIGVAPADLDAVASASPYLRPRFGWAPKFLVGIITNLGQGACNQDNASERHQCMINSNCVLHVFASYGAMVGVEQNITSTGGQMLTGAEVLASCPYISVDASYVHLFPFNGTDVDRVDFDVFGSIPAQIDNFPFDIGPYVSGQISYERGNPAAGPEDPTRADRTLFMLTGGLRFQWN